MSTFKPSVFCRWGWHNYQCHPRPQWRVDSRFARLVRPFGPFRTSYFLRPRLQCAECGTEAWGRGRWSQTSALLRDDRDPDRALVRRRHVEEGEGR